MKIIIDEYYLKKNFKNINFILFLKLEIFFIYNKITVLKPTQVNKYIKYKDVKINYSEGTRQNNFVTSGKKGF